ncbi:MAG: ATPase [Betaproteobacteria bacterium RBG_19FT_COMBO_58_11]|nr:MAG: ATPase [Betaproteobacteria bacterium RBG_19FT_COMBO_58_11]
MEKRPIAIDLDPQAHLTLTLGVSPVTGETSISAFFRDDIPLPALLRELATGVRVIPAHMELAKVEALQSRSATAARKLKAGLEESLGQEGAPILIDCCPTLGVLSLNALLAADRVLVPVSADFLSMQSVNKLDLALKALEGPLNRKFEKRIVLTRFDGRRKLSFEIYDKLKERYGEQLCETRIVENVALAASPSQAKDVFAYAPSSPGARDYAALTLELVEKGFFSQLVD